MKLTVWITIFLAAALLFTKGAGAIGLEVSPPSLQATVSAGEDGNATLSVKNPSGEVTIIRVYPDDLEDFIKINPESFVLESGESRNVDLKLNFAQAGQFKTAISVVARPLSSEAFGAGSGLKIPLTIVVNNTNSALMASIANTAGFKRLLGSFILLLITTLVLVVCRLAFYEIKKLRQSRQK